MAALGMADLTGVYQASEEGRLDLFSSIGSLKLDGGSGSSPMAQGTPGNNDGPDYFSIQRGIANIFNVSHNTFNGRTTIYSLFAMDFGPEPSLLPNRTTLSISTDVVELLREDRSFPESMDSGFLRWGSTLDMEEAGSTVGGMISLDGRVNFNANANPFGMGNALRAGITWAGIDGANLGPGFVFAGNNVFLADGGDTTMSQARIFFDNSRYDVDNGGTLTGGAVGHVSMYCGGTINLGASLALRRGVFVPDVAGTGDLTDQIGVDIADLSFASGRNIGIRSSMTAGAGRAFIEHTGSARSLFGGEVEIDGNLNHDGALIGFHGADPIAQDSGWLVSNLNALRAYDADSTTLHEIADTLGTLIETVLKTRGDIAA